MANLRLGFRSVSLVLLLIFAGCGLTLPYGQTPHQAAKVQQIGDGPIEGKIQGLDDSTIDLAQNPERIQVVMFVSDTCSVCRSETAGLVADRESRGIPKNVDFYSIVLGIKDDAIDWKSDLGVNWIVGIDPGNTLFKTYCRTNGQNDPTPCILLHNPKLDKRTKLIGAHTLSEIEQTTGKWEVEK